MMGLMREGSMREGSMREGSMREGSMRERSIEDGKGPGALMVGRMDARDVQTNIPTGR